MPQLMPPSTAQLMAMQAQAMQAQQVPVEQQAPAQQAPAQQAPTQQELYPILKKYSPAMQEAAKPFDLQYILKNIDQQTALRNKSRASQEKGAADLEQRIAQYEEPRSGFDNLDLTNMMAYADSLNGTRMAQTYKAPTSNEARLKESIDLRQALQGQRDKISDNDMQALQAELGNRLYTSQLKTDLTPEGRLAKLPTTERARLDNSREALNSVRDMSAALESGENIVSLVGDNKFTLARSQFEEALGRMQSGGAIGEKEAQRFRDMAPKLMDTPQIRIQKLKQLQQKMAERMKTSGFDEQTMQGLGYGFSPAISEANQQAPAAPAGWVQKDGYWVKE